MENKIEQLLDIIGRDKKKLKHILIVYIVVMIIILAIIWWPKEKEALEYESVDINLKKETMAQSYIDRISYILTNNKTEYMEEMMSSKYCNYVDKSASSIVQELKEQGFFSKDVNLSGMTVYEDGSTYIYTTVMKVGNKSKTISLIETTPYNPKVVFDDFYSYEKLEDKSVTDGIAFTIKDMYKATKYVEINLQVENTNDYDITFDFNTVNGVKLLLTDGTSYNVSNLISGQNATTIKTKSTINKNFVFEIPIQLQNKIEYILFNDVKLSSAKKDIKLLIY